MILPTATIVFMVEATNPLSKTNHLDTNFLLDGFGVTWDSNLGRFIQSDRRDKPIIKCSQFWVRINSIETNISETFAHNWDKSGINTGGYIGIWNASVAPEISGSYEKKKDLNLELNKDSILFFENMDTSISSSRSENYITSIKYPDCRIDIIDLTFNVKNITLVGQVEIVSRNFPTTDSSGSFLQRRVIRISDNTGICDITLWGDLCLDASKVLPHQTVVISALDVFFENGKRYINATQKLGSKIFVINTLSSILLSSDLRSITNINSAYRKKISYLCAFIRDIRTRTYVNPDNSATNGDLLIPIHDKCLTKVKVKHNMLETDCVECSNCRDSSIDHSSIKYAFDIEVYVDDGYTCEWMTCTYEAANIVLDINPQNVIENKGVVQISKIIAPIIGKEFIMCISTLKKTDSSICKFRIDCALVYQNFSGDIKNYVELV
ncbi:hypothetical protein BB561_002000 [Smittium simulii]|uniref:Cell division control protein 24 OB domain-containing protein n=1 Tax=Smittium simulii TaxID=133385 RepID=A0A2T9YS43_9FUNG|nr:hypothetical protein BB561_002000 [Smittium simulii]